MFLHNGSFTITVRIVPVRKYYLTINITVVKSRTFESSAREYDTE
jgi:hypothetical protein